MRSLLLALALILSGCVSAPRLEPADAAAPAFDPIRFFAGRTQGEGTLRVALGRTRAVRVRSVGRVQADGTLLLEQAIEEEGRPARTRQWRMREVSPGRYTGSLSDAAGPVAGEVVGSRLRLRFRMNGGLDAEQWLSLAPGGGAARNILVVRKFGITVAALEETIRRMD